jgi:3'-phosphoadenosine 5'-phosphosulfate sulfotransferase (PAPS reductase)/FAD synthetase
MTDTPLPLVVPAAGPQMPMVEIAAAPPKPAELARERRGRQRARPTRVAAQFTLPGTLAVAAWEDVVRGAKTRAEREAIPVVPWEERVRRWREHASDPGFLARVERAKSVAKAGAERGKMFCSLSGGKDSTALAGLLAEAGVACRGVYASSALDYPDTVETVDALGRAVGMAVDVLAPAELERHVARICSHYGVRKPRKRKGLATYDEWDVLRALPPDVCVLDDEPMGFFVRASGHANLLTSYQYASGHDGSFSGVRRAESLARHFNWRKKGSLYRSSLDDKWTCTPLVEWSGKDVWTFITTRGLPWLPYYRLAYETGLSRDDPAKIRTGGVLVYAAIANKGVLRPVARIYPELWARLTRLRPELLRFILERMNESRMA